MFKMAAPTKALKKNKICDPIIVARGGEN